MGLPGDVTTIFTHWSRNFTHHSYKDFSYLRDHPNLLTIVGPKHAF